MSGSGGETVVETVVEPEIAAAKPEGDNTDNKEAPENAENTENVVAVEVAAEVAVEVAEIEKDDKLVKTTADEPGGTEPDNQQNNNAGVRKESLENLEGNNTDTTNITTANTIVANDQYVGGENLLKGFKIRPDLLEKFRPGVVQSLIEKTLKGFFEGRLYSAEDSSMWNRTITNEIHTKVKNLEYKRYKLVTYVVLGEHRGGGISVSNRCLWDADTDCKASYTYLSETLFCVGTVYGFYFY